MRCPMSLNTSSVLLHFPPAKSMNVSVPNANMKSTSGSLVVSMLRRSAVPTRIEPLLLSSLDQLDVQI